MIFIFFGIAALMSLTSTRASMGFPQACKGRWEPTITSKRLLAHWEGSLVWSERNCVCEYWLFLAVHIRRNTNNMCWCCCFEHTGCTLHCQGEALCAACGALLREGEAVGAICHHCNTALHDSSRPRHHICDCLHHGSYLVDHWLLYRVHLDPACHLRCKFAAKKKIDENDSIWKWFLDLKSNRMPRACDTVFWGVEPRACRHKALLKIASLAPPSPQFTEMFSCAVLYHRIRSVYCHCPLLLFSHRPGKITEGMEDCHQDQACQTDPLRFGINAARGIAVLIILFNLFLGCV